MNAAVLDLSGRLLAPVAYFPFPALVPDRLLLNAAGQMALDDLRRLGACADGGPDAIHAMVAAAPELPTDPGAEAPTVVEGGLSASRAVVELAGDDGSRGRVASWWATVSGLTFHADGEQVYVDGPHGRVVLYDGNKRKTGATVWAAEQEVAGPGWTHGPAGKSRRYESYSALVDARNASRLRGPHGRVPDAIGSLLGMAPMVDKRKPTITIDAEDRVEPHGLMVRRVGRRYRLRLDDATAKYLHGEKAGSKQAVLRYDTVVEANDADVGHAAMQLLREFDTEMLVAVVGVLMNAADTGNRTQRIGAADLARIRGKQLTRSSDKQRFSAMSELLSKVVFEVAPVKGDGTTIRLPLLVNQGEVVVRGGRSLPLVTVNEALYRAMRAAGHGILMDRSLLTADLNAHEWEVRVAMALDAQWSLGWVVNGYAKGKRLRRSARQLLLDDAGVPYDFKAERAKRGAAAVRGKLAGVLDSMVRLGWLKAWKVVKLEDNPADDNYEFTPPDALTRSLNTHRRPALEPPKPALA